ncbi:hypothetical protein AXF42_Ash011215 [Apostasia shenzhenica]|uniref:Uncharacterized protein n=1 Tax=Apostasia shenzhenica TaxID=1088818 RepID=A0A2I0AL99_9ASPA|nr:hypothetical protein AXF42_Ash011215 [Apostasia shenzhenica]
MITKGFSGGGSGRGADVRRSPSRSSSRGDAHLSPPSSSSLSTSSSCFFPSLAPWGCGEFGFEAVELEAARALAEFSRPAPVRVWRESSQGLDMGTYWADDNSQIKNAICKKVEERVTTEENPEIPKSGGDCCMNFAAAASRHRRRDNLTEALRDELSKRVADLSLDNQKMKVVNAFFNR